MKVTILFTVTMVLVCTSQLSQAQSSVEVSMSDLSWKDSRVQISYDLLNSIEADQFSIRVEVSDAKGQLFDARSLSGDIGEKVYGGLNKKIIWDIVADSIFLDDEEIFVEIYALFKPPPEVAEPVKAEPVVEPVVEEKTVMIEEQSPGFEDRTSSEETASMKDFNRTAIIVQSLALPGLGLSRVNPGQPHWIKGVVGYGCIAGALYFNDKAVTSYDAYKNSSRLEDVDDLYNKAVKQDAISEVLAFAAIGVWVTDLVWNILGTADLNLTSHPVSHKGVSFSTTVEPVSLVPLIALRYKF